MLVQIVVVTSTYVSIYPYYLLTYLYPHMPILRMASTLDESASAETTHATPARVVRLP